MKLDKDVLLQETKMLDYNSLAIRNLISKREWNGNRTYIQRKGISQDFGIYNSPDELLEEHHQEMSAFL